MRRSWFSAMLRFVILIEDEGAVRQARSVIVFLAEDWSAAKERAIALGQTSERTYIGGTGQEVRWRLEEVETLDELGESITEGQEIYSEPVDLPEGRTIAFDACFEPAQSQPSQSGI